MVKKKKVGCWSCVLAFVREAGFLDKDVKSWFEMGTTNKIATHRATSHAQMLSKTNKQRNDFKTNSNNHP